MKWLNIIGWSMLWAAAILGTLFLICKPAHAEVGGISFMFTSKQVSPPRSALNDLLHYLLNDIQKKRPFELRVKIVNRELRGYDIAQHLSVRYIIRNARALRLNPVETARKILDQMEDERLIVLTASSSAVLQDFYWDVEDELWAIVGSNGDQLAIPRALKSLDKIVREKARQYRTAITIISPVEIEKLLDFAKEVRFNEAELIVQRAVNKIVDLNGATVFCSSEVIE